MTYQDKPSLNELCAFIFEDGEDIMHYGKGHLDGGHSGRYEWRRRKDPYQTNGDFLSRIHQLRKEGLTFTDEDGKTWTGDNAIAKSMGLTTTQFRTQLALAKDEQ